MCASLGSQLVAHVRSDSVAVCWSPIIDLREGGHWAVEGLWALGDISMTVCVGQFGTVFFATL